jgi:hypothetical protein
MLLEQIILLLDQIQLQLEIWKEFQESSCPWDIYYCKGDHNGICFEGHNLCWFSLVNHPHLLTFQIAKVLHPHYLFSGVFLYL